LLNNYPDFAILEEKPPTLHGFDLVKMMRGEGLKTQFIFFLPFKDAKLIRKAFYSNVSSVLFASDGIIELAECLNTLSGGHSDFRLSQDEENTGECKSDSSQDLLRMLTPCQLKILALVTRHMTMPEIAKELFISKHTVNNHIANIRKRLQLKGRGVILKYALANQHRLSEIEQQLNYNNYV